MIVDRTAALPGDWVFAETKGLYGRLIQLGQWFRPSWRKWSKFHHMALVESNDGGTVTCLQMGRHCERVSLDEVAPGGQVVVWRPTQALDVDAVLAYARSLLGIDYGVLTILSIALNILTPSFLRIDFRRAGTLICSAYVIRSAEHGALDYPWDPFQAAPAQVAAWEQVPV